ncbi:Hypothetical protein R9X50_00755500 [Acrodontium crateriforme]|uniref:UPF3 domain-containing protein n=1 Tax=Acrodontium crateriforme TaxID=150365 RepID=A0AAQ3M9W8_9PEZI|nr:Hypothetical protein R9X50_00755500 [Acrodontium crateriforme]
MPPKVLAKPSGDRPSGVLPINAATRAGRQSNPPRAPQARLKLEVRRLPPGLTLAEFEGIVGDEWKLGFGKVDWREYRQGRVRSPGKLPEQSRCYIHFKTEADVKPFEAKFLNVVFHDAAGTHRLPEIRHLPPTLGFAPNQRIPLPARPRADNRQGTIDTDAEFIAFLEAETQPIVKPAAVDISVEKDDKPRATSTPLIDDLRERKANKAKAAANKADKEKDKKGGAQGKNETKESAKKGKAEPAEKGRKQTSGKQQAQATAQTPTPPKIATPARNKKGAAPPAKAQSGNATQPAAEKPTTEKPARGQRQRANAEGIKKMLQKDLGIKPKEGAQSQKTPSNSSAKPQTPTPAAITSAASSRPSTPASKQAKPPKTTPAAATTASTTKAYLKHANPSQGMTEILIQTALATFGEMVSVTIDPRKGTAVAVFRDNAGLKKALEKKKVPVANGTVEVLEFREKGNSSGGNGGGRGGRGNGKGGKAAKGSNNNAGGKGAPAAASASTPPPAATNPA